jgi:hypothetical protein
LEGGNLPGYFFASVLNLFAESCLKQNPAGTCCPHVTFLHTAARFLSLNHTKMANLLQIASRVEAAMAAYTSVCDFCDRTQWKEKFREEFVSIHLHHLHIVRALYI